MAKRIPNEFIVNKVEELFDKVEWLIRDEKAYVKKFNEKMRELVPELKDSKKNFYNIYNTYQPQ